MFSKFDNITQDWLIIIPYLYFLISFGQNFGTANNIHKNLLNVSANPLLFETTFLISEVISAFLEAFPFFARAMFLANLLVL